MDWRLFWTTFTTIFLAEMGDKTQFAAMAASSQSKSMLPVWLAVVLALGIAGTLGVFAGNVLGAYIHPGAMRWISGMLFIGMGIWILVAR